MTNEGTKENGTNKRSKSKITAKEALIGTPVSNPNAFNGDVNICKQNNNANNDLQSPSSKKITHRKRSRPESFSHGPAVKPFLFSPLQGKKRGSPTMKENKCNDYNKRNRREMTSSISSSTPMDFSQSKRNLHLPMPCKVDDHILLNDNSLDKHNPTPFAPESPVRSVVSCDGSQYELEMNVISKPNDTEGTPEGICVESPLPDKDEKELSSLPYALQLHIKALRSEASLAPMKPLLSRLMVHPGHNRKGTFNSPVDHEALGLKEYTTIVKKPMDLGTVKKNLHSNIYLSHADAASDIRLCFQNALLFNPPLHPIHEAAKNLLSVFETSYSTILKDRAEKLTSSCQTDIFVPLPAHVPLPPMQHTCQACCGRTCKVCNEKCLSLEPTLVICAGAQCAGSKIRRGTIYHCSTDGAKAWCQRCFTTLPAIISKDDSDTNNVVQYKRDLLKRRNDEDIVERWLTCNKCGEGVHEVCAFANEFSVDHSNFECPQCTHSVLPVSSDNLLPFEEANEIAASSSEDVYSYLNGHATPQKIKHTFQGSSLDSRTLPSCSIAEFIELKIQERMISLNCPPNAEKTLTIRVISDCEKVFQIPDVIKRHFREANESTCNSTKIDGISEFNEPPSEVKYEAKAIAIFQRIDGMDVCIFCMYVQEYEGNSGNDSKRIYIAYLDSVEHLRPRELRTNIYHETLVAYLATARARGFRYAHIWSCPPSRGNSFIFWGHPASQKIPTKERLLSWYHSAISHGLNQGVITDVKSLYESSFQEYDEKRNNAKGTTNESSKIMVCPPLLEGDFWIEETVRVHSNSTARFFRSKNSKTYSPHESFCPEDLFSGKQSNCPAMHVATVLQDDIMLHPSAVAFCEPVNAAALKLHDYHDVIEKPMDLGTVTMQLLLGEYDTFVDVVNDIELVFNNAMRYNPPGHVVHSLALDLLQYSRKQIETLVEYWQSLGVKNTSEKDSSNTTVEGLADLSMKLGTSISSKASVLPQDTKSTDESSPSSISTQSVNSSSQKLDLLTGGPEAVAKRMVGEDVWLLDKRHNHKTNSKNKKSKKEKTKYNYSDGMLKQKESWLGDDVSTVVRRLRTDFFICQLYQDDESSSVAGQVKDEEFHSYIADFDITTVRSPMTKTECSSVPKVADTRHGLLEFSQYRNFQFDTIRRAKYSTAMLLLYLQHHDLPGIIPTCATCQHEIESVRWRRSNKAFDERRRSSQTMAIRMTSLDMSREELCTPCYDQVAKKEAFVPICVSLKRNVIEK